VDLSPLILLVALQVLLIVPILWLEMAAGRMLPGLSGGG
jgi:hypothetical protein